MPDRYFHSVTLNTDKCVGCTDCIKRCPTEAIRVHNGKAEITNERCIDCGMCIYVCRHHAKKATTDPISIIDNFKYKIAIPAPTFYAQFKETYDINKILTAIKKLGFDDVFEVARAAEAITERSRQIMAEGTCKKPVISSACPAITRLISKRFPTLIDNILPIISPMEAAAMAARKHAEDKGIAAEEIGIFFISPCAAKVTNVRKPIEVRNTNVDGVISMEEVYLLLLPIIKSLKPEEIEPLCQCRGMGVKWAEIGGEGHLLQISNAISVDGVEDVIKVMELVENGQLENVDFIEGLACKGGCLGGALTVTNAFVAKNYLLRVEKNAKKYAPEQTRNVDSYFEGLNLNTTKKIKADNILKLDDDLNVAIMKLGEITELYNQLPQIDCGSCGAPTCMALAEDIVQGKAMLEDCTFMLRDKVKKLAEDMVGLADMLPPSIGNKSNKKSTETVETVETVEANDGGL
ncbi:MAG: [Fe-Fe] hydrogenase large subunit C-terminal domain-containing protein [Lachnospiraceae bacterium]|nr:[Fe-Fe] hydrogenase large subunit C-terminal domain-containing protein [Lachnospiraceae bacterium]